MPHSFAEIFAAALEHHRAGRLREAAALYHVLLLASPGLDAPARNLDTLLRDLMARARQHWQAGQPDQALDLLHGVAEALPERDELRWELGNLRLARNDPRGAGDSFTRAVALRPESAMACFGLGGALLALGRNDAADGLFRRTHALNPELAEAFSNRGLLAHYRGAAAEAIALHRRAVALRPDAADFHYNLAVVLSSLGYHAEALAGYGRATRLDPGMARARLNRNLTRLRLGDLPGGWRLWSRPSPRFPDRLAWNGEALAGHRILLHAVEGHGDTLQCVRYAPMVARRGGTVVLEVQPGLVRLLRGQPGVQAVHGQGEALPPFDRHASILDLPRLFGTTLDSIPGPIPYVRADAGLAAAWRERLRALPGRKVGLVWAGDPRPQDADAHIMDAQRSLPLSRLAPLAAATGVSFVSLQKGPAGVQAATPPVGMALHDPTGALSDFADTAALVEALDLVVTVDTAVAHLAGAMGKPVWVLSRHDGCWRWLIGREDSPWYPTLRLFRQPAPGDWDAVAARVAGELRLWATRR